VERTGPSVTGSAKGSVTVGIGVAARACPGVSIGIGIGIGVGIGAGIWVGVATKAIVGSAWITIVELSEVLSTVGGIGVAGDTDPKEGSPIAIVGEGTGEDVWADGVCPEMEVGTVIFVGVPEGEPVGKIVGVPEKKTGGVTVGGLSPGTSELRSVLLPVGVGAGNGNVG